MMTGENSKSVSLSYVSNEESFNCSFNLNDDDSLGKVLEKVELMLFAMGFLVEGKQLQLIDTYQNPNKQPGLNLVPKD